MVNQESLTPWRHACEAALQQFTREDALRFWRVSHRIGGEERPIFDYRFEHTLAVVKLARWLSPRVGADLDVVECAAWLHDSRKRLNDQVTPDTHAKDAASEVGQRLSGTDFPKEKIPAVRHAILHHVGLRLTRRLEPLETACLWDSDKLSKLGAASLIHFACISGGFQPIDTAEVLARGERWIGLAEDIAASMNTLPAQEEAQRRLSFLIQYYRRLREEWVDPMEVCMP